jgi:hypothetical protein
MYRNVHAVLEIMQKISPAPAEKSRCRADSTCLNLSNAIKLTNKFQKKGKSLDKGKKMCGKALKTRLIFRGRAHEIHS